MQDRVPNSTQFTGPIFTVRLMYLDYREYPYAVAECVNTYPKSNLQLGCIDLFRLCHCKYDGHAPLGGTGSRPLVFVRGAQL